MLVAVDGRSYAEAAGVLGVPPGTVASRVARARLALAEAFEVSNDSAPAPAPTLVRTAS
jgi:RNA polymerase sigma-70 factor, ECF subfamily